MEPSYQKPSLWERWSATRPTKTLMFWSWVAVVIVTAIIGFSWGGWVTGRTARAMAQTAEEHAVVTRLAPICVAQFKEDPKKAEGLQGLKSTEGWDRGEYVMKQGWATMPGESTPDAQVADQCVHLLMAQR